MRIARLAVLLTVTVAMAATAPTAQAAPGTGWQGRMLAEVNATRAQSGIAPLRLCRTLGRAATKYAVTMATSDSFGHVGLDGSLPWDRVRAEGYAYRTVGENLGGRFATVATVMDGWRKSPSHLATMLDPAYTHVGFGYAHSDSADLQDYWVQEYGSGGRCSSR